MPKKARSRPKVETKPNGFVCYIMSKTDTAIGFQKKDLAAAIGITPAAFTARMKTGKFFVEDMVKIFEITGATKEEKLESLRR